jgi:hypothetical protein
MKHFSTFLVVFLLVISVSNAQFKYENPVWVKNNTASALTNVQVGIKVNTQALISAGWMLASGNDIRFVATCNSSTFLGHWVEGYLNTDSTKIWVNVPAIGASDSTQIFMYYGNTGASNISTLAVFYGPHSSTDSVVVTTAGGSASTQRGFRFTPNEDVLVGYFGKREPTGTQRYVTLFDFTSQAILAQIQVSAGAAGVYNYNTLASPLWLKSGQQYVLELYQGTGDGYYYGTSSQIGQHLTYGDMRYCNSCTQNTFPTSVLTNYHYGTPDLLYYTKQNISPAPTANVLQAADTVTPAIPVNLTATPGNQSALLKCSKNSEFDMYQYGFYKNTTNNPSTATFIAAANHPDTSITATGLTNGTLYYFWVRAADRYCVNRVSGYSLVASCTPSGGITYPVPELIYYKFENNPTSTTTPNYASAPVGTNPAPITGDVLGPGGMVDTCLIGTTGAGANGITPGWSWNVSSNWTMAFWVSGLAETSSGSPTYLFGDAGAASFRCFYGGAALPNYMYLRGAFSTTGYLIPCTMPGSYMFHIVFDGTAYKIYNNGVLIQTNSSTVPVGTSGTGFKVAGYGTTSYSLNANGKFDEFRLYNRALTQAEITATYNHELPYTVTSVEPITTSIPDKFYLSQNYPNPFNPTTTIKFGLKKDALVEMKVFDVVGKEIVTLINAQYKAGYHSIEFNGTNFASGIYFYKIKAGDFTEVKKMVLIK